MLHRKSPVSGISVNFGALKTKMEVIITKLQVTAAIKVNIFIAALRIENQTVPSGIYSALEQALIIESVLDFKNDLTTKWIARDNWTYSLPLACNIKELNFTNVVLTLHGVDTFAKVYLNDELLGETSNMFVRYRFNVKNVLRNEVGKTNDQSYRRY